MNFVNLINLTMLKGCRSQICLNFRIVFPFELTVGLYSISSHYSVSLRLEGQKTILKCI